MAAASASFNSPRATSRNGRNVASPANAAPNRAIGSEMVRMPCVSIAFAPLARTGLGAVAAHANVATGDRQAFLAAAGRLGLKALIVPWADPDGLRDRAGVLTLAAAINEAARRAADEGIAVGYHNHDFEFRQHVDGVVMSVLRDVSRAPALYAAQQKLAPLGVTMLGAVILGTEPEFGDHSYGYALAQAGK